MRIDAAATQPVFGGLCHQLIGIAGRVIKRPRAEHPYGGRVLTQVTPESARFERCDNRSQQLDFGPMLRPYSQWLKKSCIDPGKRKTR